MANRAGIDPEIAAIMSVNQALSSLNGEAQARVLDYVSRKLGIAPAIARDAEPRTAEVQSIAEPTIQAPQNSPNQASEEPEDDELPGVNAIAKKWMKRNGLASSTISKLFTLGVDEIDLVAKTVPGESKKKKINNIFLLQGIASYLSSGTARFTHEKVRETCLGYDAWDTGNLSKYLSEFTSDISGSKESGYSVTAHGLLVAADLIKEMVTSKKESTK